MNKVLLWIFIFILVIASSSFDRSIPQEWFVGIWILAFLGIIIIFLFD